MFTPTRFLLAALLSLSAGTSFAADVQVWSRAYDFSCGYFSRRAADVSVTLFDQSLPYGTTVNLIAGFAGREMRGGPNSIDLNWQNRMVIPAKAIDVSVWEARLEDQTLHNRTSGVFLEKLQFVFEVIAPGQEPVYVNGGAQWGWFETNTISAQVDCVENGVIPDDNWRRLQVSPIAQ